MQIKKLYFKDDKYIESIQKEIKGADAILEINDKTKEAILSFTRGSGLIAKRKAQREAENICRSGFVLNSRERVAKGYRLIVKSQDYQGEQIFRAGPAYRL